MQISSNARQLAAIMFTDIVGYSTLMHKNENLGLELLHEHRAIVREKLTAFNGSEVDTAGDGFVVKFTSAVDALKCAIDIQRHFAERNRECAPERAILLRIGIHVSEIFHTGGVFGDGVNIAARLQPLAPVGGICVSRAVFENVRGKVECNITALGAHSLKGISRKVRLYAIEIEPPGFWMRTSRTFNRFATQKTVRRAFFAFCMAAVGAIVVLRQIQRPIASAGDPRVAVMPFDTMGMTENENFISEGLVSGVISSLSHDGVRVLEKNSVIALKKSKKSPREIGEELGIDRLITGVLTKSGKAFKVSIAMVDAASQEILWSNDFEAPASDVLDLKNSISAAIVDRFQPSRSPAGIAPLGNSVEANNKREAYLAYLKGQFHMSRRTKDGFQAATADLERAITLDPKFAPAYAELAIASSLETWYGVKPPVEGAIKIVQYANKAQSLDPQSTEALLILAEEKIYLENDFTKAEELYRRALKSNPRHAMTHQWYAEFLAYSGKVNDSFAEADKAVELDPLNPVAVSAQGLMRYFAGDYAAAEEYLNKAIALDPELMLNYYWRGRIQLARKDYVDGIEALKKAVELSNREPMTISALAYAYAVSGDIKSAKQLQGELSADGSSRYISPYFLAKIETGLGHNAEAIKLLHRSVIEHGNQTVAALVDPEFANLRKSPEFAQALAPLKPPGPR